MPANPVAENVLGTIGTICWSGQLIPQVWKSWREKSTEGLSLWLMFLWACSSPFIGVYVVTHRLNIPLILQPQLFGLLVLISWAQCLYYGQRKSLAVSLSLLVAGIVALGSFEVAMIFAIRPSFNRGNDRPAQFFGIFSSVIIAIGLLPQYYKIWRLGEVQGISLLFITIDMLGGVFSVLSLAFAPKFDIVAVVLYMLVVILDGPVIIAALILNPRAERKRRQASEMVDVESTRLSRAPVLNDERAREASISSTSQLGSQLHDKDESISSVLGNNPQDPACHGRTSS